MTFLARFQRRLPADPALPLIRELIADAAANGCTVHLIASATRDWASATFVGARHRILLTAIASPALTAWLAALPSAQLSPGRDLLGDLTVDRVSPIGNECRIELSALTLMEA